MKAEKDELNRTKAILEEELQQLKGAEKVKEISVWMAAFWYIYDIVISALILVFVYWISIEGIEKFDVPYGCLVMMVLMISLKCAFRKWECRFDIVMQVLINDLLKPFITMFLGMIIFMKS